MRYFATLIVFVGTLIFSFYIISRVEPGKTTKRRPILNYGLILSILVTLLNILICNADVLVIGESILLGLVVSIPAILKLIKRCNEKSTIDSAAYYKPKEQSNFLLWFVPLSIFICVLYWSDIGSQITNAKWPLLSICFFWVIRQLLALLYDIRIERKIFNPIEKSKPEDNASKE
jgi:hypothetical protein